MSKIVNKEFKWKHNKCACVNDVGPCKKCCGSDCKSNEVLTEVINYWYLLAAVLIGGQFGNFLNLKIFPTRILALITAFLVLFVASRMGFRIFF